MPQTDLSRAIQDVESLKGIFIVALPDCLLFDSWTRQDVSWQAEDAAAYFGDLIRANRRGLNALGSWSQTMQVTIESADDLIVLVELENDFVVSFVFTRETPLGLVRLQVRRVLERIRESLPVFEVRERPRGVRVVEFLNRYAPDPHASLLRVALQTGIELRSLQKPEQLSEEQVVSVEESVCDILGLDELHV